MTAPVLAGPVGWELLGCLLDEGEGPEELAVRELEEETGTGPGGLSTW